MEQFAAIWEIIIHLDKHLATLVELSGVWVYIIMAFVIFAETAGVITVFLPSDTVLFAACALYAVSGKPNIFIMLPLFFVAALSGDSVNFLIGRAARNRVKSGKKLIFIKNKQLDDASRYYHKNGNLTLVISRFIPVLRSLAPFVAGISDRDYKSFIAYNLPGVAVWDILFCMLGLLFGNLPFVKQYFSLIVFGIGALSLITLILTVIAKNMFKEKN